MKALIFNRRRVGLVILFFDKTISRNEKPF